MSIDAIEMTVADWIEIPDNPRQRNTERRAKIARLKYLKTYHQIHRFVYAATIDGNIVCKLDGHTRALLWKIGDLEYPPSGKVVVLMVSVRSMTEAKQTYDTLDSQPATKKPSDIVYGACRENKFELTSPLLRSCTFLTQLTFAEHGMYVQCEPHALVKKWKSYLIALDEMCLTSNYTLLIASMLLSVKRDGADESGKFWKALDLDEGVKEGKLMDGPEALRQHLVMRRAQGSTAGYDNLADIQSRAWRAYTAFREGKRLANLHAGKPIIEIVKDLRTSGEEKIKPKYFKVNS